MTDDADERSDPAATDGSGGAPAGTDPAGSAGTSWLDLATTELVATITTPTFVIVTALLAITGGLYAHSLGIVFGGGLEEIVDAAARTEGSARVFAAYVESEQQLLTVLASALLAGFTLSWGPVVGLTFGLQAKLHPSLDRSLSGIRGDVPPRDLVVGGFLGRGGAAALSFAVAAVAMGEVLSRSFTGYSGTYFVAVLGGVLFVLIFVAVGVALSAVLVSRIAKLAVGFGVVALVNLAVSVSTWRALSRTLAEFELGRSNDLGLLVPGGGLPTLLQRFHPLHVVVDLVVLSPTARESESFPTFSLSAVEHVTVSEAADLAPEALAEQVGAASTVGEHWFVYVVVAVAVAVPLWLAVRRLEDESVAAAPGGETEEAV